MNLMEKLFLCFLIFYDFKTVVAVNDADWWKYTTIYEVYIWSFKDSDGDGIGDLKGVTSMLDHFVDLGIETLWISPYFKSPMHDMGYDVANFSDVDPLFGTMQDFDELLREMEKRGLKMMVDFVINHSSDQHPWFQKSVNKIHPYTDYYVWQDAKGFDGDNKPIPPTNWISEFGGSAWQWNEKRRQFYYHEFAVRQPELNLRNEFLKAELKTMMKFWFDKGVAGARLDATKFFIEDEKLRDEPIKNHNVPKNELTYMDLDHIYTTDLWESYQFIHELREFVDKNCTTGNDVKILVAEAYSDLKHVMMYYGKRNYKIVHFPFNFDLVQLQTFPTPKDYDRIIRNWLDNMPRGGVANWVSENHDNLRINRRLNEEYVDIILITTMVLPGVACIYYGQEIGMLDNNVRDDQVRDPNCDGVHVWQKRDPERLPMQWDDSMNAGFSSKVKPWLPVNPNYWRINVLLQKHQPRSRYHLYKTLSKLRRTKTLKLGNFTSYLVSPWVYAFSRSYNGEPTYTAIFNMGSETEIVHLHNSIPNLPLFGKVVAASINAGYVPGNRISTNPKFPGTFLMRPLSAVVFETRL